MTTSDRLRKQACDIVIFKCNKYHEIGRTSKLEPTKQISRPLRAFRVCNLARHPLWACRQQQASPPDFGPRQRAVVSCLKKRRETWSRWRDADMYAEGQWQYLAQTRISARNSCERSRMNKWTESDEKVKVQPLLTEAEQSPRLFPRRIQAPYQ